MVELTTVARGLEFPEGPVCLADGSVLVVELKAGTIARIDPTDGSIERVATCGGAPNGAALGPDGFLYVTNNGGLRWRTENGFPVGFGIPDDYTGGRIERVDLRTGDVEIVLRDIEGRTLRGPNDLAFDATGGFYFTDLGKSDGTSMDLGFVYYVDPATMSAHIVLSEMLHPNGVGLSPGDGRLYVAESHTARLWSWEVAAPGQLKAGSTPFAAGAGTLLRGFEGFRLLDSMAVEESGNICQATVAQSGIVVVGPAGDLLEAVDNHNDPFTTNICFGGVDMRTAYVTSAGNGELLAAEWPRPGLAPHFSGLAVNS
jgi:gluconolactonase